jgi:ADP-ribosylglycohydrolase
MGDESGTVKQRVEMKLPLDIVAKRISQEIRAREVQGFITDGLLERLESARGDRSALMALHQELKALQLRAGWAYHEPSTLDEIRQARPQQLALPDFYLAEAEVHNKIHGAWLGRVAGCILGKPLEIGLTQDEIENYLKGANALPLNDFIPAQSISGRRVLRRDSVPSMRGYVRYAQEDDDLNYSCLAVKLLEQYSSKFTTLNVGMNWLASIPFLWTWGPQHAVYLNLATAIGDHRADEVDLEEITGYLNPYVESLGAQIRADVYGYVCPGQPELAAGLAWRDAYLTHRKSGLYGAMWVAAMLASAFTLLDMEAIVLAGLAQVPARSRFAEAILQTIEWAQTVSDWRETGRRITEHWPDVELNVINSACVVTASLLYGWGDGKSEPSKVFERTLTTAVQIGGDPDCTGATAGSVIGLILGANTLPAKWVEPLNDTMRTCVAEFGQVQISDMAQRTFELSRIVHWWASSPSRGWGWQRQQTD